MASQAEVDALIALCVAGEYDQAAAMMRASWPSLFFGGIGAVFTAGEDVGNTIRNGAGAPSGGVGVNGDFYIDTTAKALYGPKTSGAWGSATSMIGPAPTGAANLVVATPNGSSGTASLRTLVAADIPEIPTSKGGTGVGTLAAHGVLVGNGTAGVAVTGPGAAGQVFTSNGPSADPTFQTSVAWCVKPSSEDFIALSPDSDFIYAATVAGLYEVRLFLSITAGAADGFYGEITGGTATIGAHYARWEVVGVDAMDAIVGPINGIGSVTASGFVSAVVQCDATIRVSGVGTIRVSFATASGAGADASVLVDSRMAVRRIL